MQRIPDTPPLIAPLDRAIPRVVWSVMIPTYNCSNYLIEAIESVLQQEISAGVMQIEVVDDCSTDTDVKALVENVGKGRVLYYRQDTNVGSLRNFETCIKRARGYYIHLLHGDDRVKQGFYASFGMLFERFPEAGAAFCAYDYIDDKSFVLRRSTIEQGKAGLMDNCLQKFAREQLTQYVSTIVKREVYENVGSFYGVTYGEDWIMWARIAKYYPVVYTPEVLAEYREHSSSISGLGLSNGSNMENIRKVASIVSSYLPKRDRRNVRQTIVRNYSSWLLDYSLKKDGNASINKTLYRELNRNLNGYGNYKVLIRKIQHYFLSKIRPCKGGLKIF